jgi:aspartate-semialdehyde dehydrogenase
VFCAVDMTKEATAKLEDDYARAETPLISNTSAHRWTPDVPMMIPEINSDHARIIEAQRQRLEVKRGFIAVKPNCSIQSYVPAIHPLLGFGPTKIAVSTYQAISGAGKTFETWPEMVDNLIPLIGGEEDKSEREPLKIWGRLAGGKIETATSPSIGATCIRVPASDGHMANVSVSFKHKPTPDQVLSAVRSFKNPLAGLDLPSAPRQLITYLDEPDRPQTRLDRDAGHGMGITMGRLRSDKHFDYSFITLAHNTIRGAAGGAVLMAELLVAKDYIKHR